MDALKTAFKEEAYEMLSELEGALLDLEESPGDMETIGRVFRTMHTIKGSGAMFGFDAIAGFTHEVETLYDQVRSGKTSVTKEMIDLTLAAGDCIRRMLDDPEGVDPRGVEELKGAFRSMASTAPPGSPEAAPQPKAEGPRESVTYRIRFQPHPGIFKTGANPILLLNELRELGVCAVMADMDAIPDLDGLDPEECRVSWNIILTTDRGINAIRDVFIFVEDECELRIEAVHAMGEPRTAEAGEEGPSKRLGEILVERGDVSQERLLQVLEGQKRVGEMLVDAGLVEPSRVELALIEQQHVKEVQNRRRQEALASSIRVPAEKLDKLVDLVGELVTVQARLTQTAASQESAELLGIAEEVERLTAELRDNTMNIRMLPIGATFNRFKRLVRDLSGELGKDVQLVTEGAETELDKTVIERLNDPLVHLIRNSIDHGIEAPEEREASGKPRQGTVRLLAEHSGADVVIRIEDDGAGLNGGAIRSKAVERGLIAADAELSEREVFSLIFAPGFSTARKVSSISGRGVGMDVVKRSIEALRGIIDIESRRGEGTTIALKLPLTLAIIDGLLVRIGDGHFVLPLSNIEECVELSRAEAMKSHGREMIYLRGEIVPYIRLREQFGLEGEAPLIEQVVVAETGGGKMGFVVDKVIGERQTVIKSLGRVYRDVQGISGATILGDGSVALIVDVLSLVRDVELVEQ